MSFCSGQGGEKTWTITNNFSSSSFSLFHDRKSQWEPFCQFTRSMRNHDLKNKQTIVLIPQLSKPFTVRFQYRRINANISYHRNEKFAMRMRLFTLAFIIQNNEIDKLAFISQILISNSVFSECRKTSWVIGNVCFSNQTICVSVIIYYTIHSSSIVNSRAEYKALWIFSLLLSASKLAV